MAAELTPVVFAPAIMSHQASLERGDFDEAFYYSLLLNPALGIGDTTFFLTPAMERHFDRGNSSWLRAAVECGAIIPIFRSGHSFEKVLHDLIKEKFSGMPLRHRPKTAAQISRLQRRAKILDRLVSRSIQFPPVERYNLGRNLANTVQKKFLGRTPPVDPSRIPFEFIHDADSFWERTRDWRKWIKSTIAYREEMSGEGHGFRLSDYLQVVGRKLGLSSEDMDNVRDASSLLKLVDERKLLSDSDLQRLKELIVLLDMLYLRNLVIGFQKTGTKIGLTMPRWHPFSSFYDLGFFRLPRSQQRRDIDALQEAVHSSPKLSVPLPKLGALKNVPGSKFLTMWEQGREYRETLQQWRQSPTKNAADFAEALKSYSDMVVRETGGKYEIFARHVVGLPANLWLLGLTILGGTVAAAGSSFFFGAQPSIELEKAASEAGKAFLTGGGTTLLGLLGGSLLIGRAKAEFTPDRVTLTRGRRQLTLTYS